jgi:hypothetical protein
LNRALKRSIQEWSVANVGSTSYSSSFRGGGTWGTAFRKREQNNGITVIATTNEASSDKQNASASAEKRNLATP